MRKSSSARSKRSTATSERCSDGGAAIAITSPCRSKSARRRRRAVSVSPHQHRLRYSFAPGAPPQGATRAPGPPRRARARQHPGRETKRLSCAYVRARGEPRIGDGQLRRALEECDVRGGPRPTVLPSWTWVAEDTQGDEAQPSCKKARRMSARCSWRIFRRRKRLSQESVRSTTTGSVPGGSWARRHSGLHRTAERGCYAGAAPSSTGNWNTWARWRADF